jgi:GT2 family glycosyltransferase
MLNEEPRVVIMYLVWDEEPKRYLEDVVLGVKKQTYKKENLEFLIVYNSHKEEHSSQAPYIRDMIEKNKHDLPHVTILEQEENLGFSGGNNLGMQWAIDNKFEYVFLHNGDALLGGNCIEKLVEKMEGDDTIGSSQPLIFLHPEVEKINTAGNALHYLMVGYGEDYKLTKREANLPEVQETGYLSGAAILMRTELLHKYGLWDHNYFMYHEDTDYSLRLKLLGYRNVVVRDAEFFHKYEFKRSIEKYFWIERNRYVLLLLFYKVPTLIVIFPMLLVFEFGLMIFALKGGWFDKRIEVYKYWLKAENWTLWLKKRKQIQKTRKISDRELLKNSVQGVYFQEEEMRNPLLLYVGNPLMTVYYWVIVRVLVWW